MTFPANDDADPDPTTQIAWPGARNKRIENIVEEHHADGSDDPSGQSDSRARTNKSKDATGKRRMSTLDLFNISISMAGAQIAWTVELGYVAPARVCLTA